MQLQDSKGPFKKYVYSEGGKDTQESIQKGKRGEGGSSKSVCTLMYCSQSKYLQSILNK